MMRDRFVPSFTPDPTEQADDWALTPEQMLFMLQHHNDIELAFNGEDMDSLAALAETPEFRNLFSEMGFDEAYDRYLTRLEAGSDAS